MVTADRKENIEMSASIFPKNQRVCTYILQSKAPTVGCGQWLHQFEIKHFVRLDDSSHIRTHICNASVALYYGWGWSLVTAASFLSSLGDPHGISFGSWNQPRESLIHGSFSFRIRF